ncbi:MAG: hypothetical protein AAGC76_05420 [Luteibacter sp.]|uniref:hypothetical protein n=1 Tax=Luteibacter sp. TaxID=1886636 RepID=UPI0028067095|nr:hypothetical protein [Luteibacter sp.]MDQ7995277.1 hypothetical protein [Luteibacter sp.]
MNPVPSDCCEDPPGQFFLSIDEHTRSIESIAPNDRVIPHDKVATTSGIAPNRRKQRRLIATSKKTPSLSCAAIEVDGQHLTATIRALHHQGAGHATLD